MSMLDMFCGAGGSSTGAVAAGAEVKYAVNHWPLAIETHNTNHPNADHACHDVRTVHPKYYPSTDIFWASPECVSHTLAKGKPRKGISQLDLFGKDKVDPAEERSRATMNEVVAHAGYHLNPIVIVENVVDIRYWEHYETWIRQMVNLGYEYKTLYLNAMFFGVPQSRDRWYTVFWRKGNKAPNLDFRPTAHCLKCDRVISAVQSWKKNKQWGRYGANRQYVYRCPKCASEVKPPTVPAAAVIDWSLPAPLVGDRKKPLQPKTLQRIKAGLEKFSKQAVIIDLAYTHAKDSGMVSSSDEPLPTQTGRQTLSLAMPPFVMSYYSRDDAQSGINEPLPVVPTENRHSVVIPPYMVVLKNSALDGYTPPPMSLDDPLSTVVASASQHGLVVPQPFFLNYNNGLMEAQSTDDPLPTIATRNTPPVVIPYPFIVQLRKDCAATGVGEPLSTVTAGGGHHGLVNPDELLENCGFRMLEPYELKRAMSFPRDYFIKGNKRDQVRQVGNAVACNVAEWIIRQCLESLAS